MLDGDSWKVRLEEKKFKKKKKSFIFYAKKKGGDLVILGGKKCTNENYTPSEASETGFYDFSYFFFVQKPDGHLFVFAILLQCRNKTTSL